MNPDTKDPAPVPTTEKDTRGGSNDEPVRLVSRIRATANFVFLVAGVLFLLGFLLTIALSGTLDESHMHLLTQATAYAGFLALIGFITSIISIIIENRSDTHPVQEEET